MEKPRQTDDSAPEKMSAAKLTNMLYAIRVYQDAFADSMTDLDQEGLQHLQTLQKQIGEAICQADSLEAFNQQVALSAVRIITHVDPYPTLTPEDLQQLGIQIEEKVNQ